MVDLAIGTEAASALVAEASHVARRIVLLSPPARHELAALGRAGFDSYLIKPVRASSLRMRMQAETAPDPARAGVAEAAPASGGARAGGAGSAAGLPVLVAEDNEINALLTGALLRKLGQRPTVAPGGADAVEAWQAAAAAGAPFAAVLMDVHMPGLDGVEATRRIRALEHAGGRPATPIFALTANAFADDRQACLDAGMNGVLIKPLERERLKELLESLAAPPLAA
jgi:CheY-like chemotaxis protein